MKGMSQHEIDQLFAQTLTGNYDDESAWEAVHTLRRFGTREIFDQAARWCKSANPAERARGVDVLAQLGKTAEHRSNSFLEDSYVAVCQMLGLEKEIQPISSALHALGHLDNPAAIPVITSYQSHPVAEIRFAVACALGSFANDPDAVRALMALTRDSDDDVRDWAVFGLGNLGDADSTEIRDAIFARLEDSNDDVREEALVGLAKRKDTRVLPALLTALNQSELDDPGVSMLTIEAAFLMLGFDEQRKGWDAAEYAAALRERFSL
jgi:HEAT repeat protein